MWICFTFKSKLCALKNICVEKVIHIYILVFINTSTSIILLLLRLIREVLDNTDANQLLYF